MKYPESHLDELRDIDPEEQSGMRAINSGVCRNDDIQRIKREKISFVKLLFLFSGGKNDCKYANDCYCVVA